MWSSWVLLLIQAKFTVTKLQRIKHVHVSWCYRTRGITDSRDYFGRWISRCDRYKQKNAPLPHVRNADGCAQDNNLCAQEKTYITFQDFRGSIYIILHLISLVIHSGMSKSMCACIFHYSFSSWTSVKKCWLLQPQINLKHEILFFYNWMVWSELNRETTEMVRCSFECLLYHITRKKVF